MENVGDGDNNCNWHIENGPESLGKGLDEWANWRSNRNHSNYTFVEIG